MITKQIDRDIGIGILARDYHGVVLVIHSTTKSVVADPINEGFGCITRRKVI